MAPVWHALMAARPWPQVSEFVFLLHGSHVIADSLCHAGAQNVSICQCPADTWLHVLSEQCITCGDGTSDAGMCAHVCLSLVFVLMVGNETLSSATAALLYVVRSSTEKVGIIHASPIHALFGQDPPCIPSAHARQAPTWTVQLSRAQLAQVSQHQLEVGGLRQSCLCMIFAGMHTGSV
jgi:hypothetical protein